MVKGPRTPSEYVMECRGSNVWLFELDLQCYVQGKEISFLGAGLRTGWSLLGLFDVCFMLYSTGYQSPFWKLTPIALGNLRPA